MRYSVENVPTSTRYDLQTQGHNRRPEDLPAVIHLHALRPGYQTSHNRPGNNRTTEKQLAHMPRQ